MVQILGGCPEGLIDIISFVSWVIIVICFLVPIILIILCVLDIAKIVTAGNIDDKLKKEVTSRIVTRIIFAVIIFLVPSIVRLLFDFVPVDTSDSTLNGVTWQTCWDSAK